MLSEFRKWSQLGVLLALTTGTLLGQSTATTSPKTAVNPDGTITFRLTYPGAKEVSFRTVATLQPLPMTADANGLWTASTPPLQPNYFAYTFVVDGVHMSDPLNGSQIPNYVELFSEIWVPAATPASWELTSIPHGTVGHGVHFQPGPEILDGVQFRGIGGKIGGAQTERGIQIRADLVGSVCVQSVPDQAPVGIQFPVERLQERDAPVGVDLLARI